MSGGRKRKRSSGEQCDARKRQRIELLGTNRDGLHAPDAVNHPVLAQYYPKLQTLRQYMVCKLPATSKIRRKKISAIGSAAQEGVDGIRDGLEASLGQLLDTTIGGVPQTTDEREASWEDLSAQWIFLSQKGDESYVTLRDGPASGRPSWSQTDVSAHACTARFSDCNALIF
jgi:hypothetical protein